MKRIGLAVTAAIAALALAGAAEAGSKRGYVTKNGTYVPPTVTTKPNSTQYDNYSTKGNVNPYTGRPGTRTPTR